MNIDNIIAKFVLGKADKEEKNILESWKNESEGNLSILKETIKLNEISTNLIGYQEVDTAKAWEKVATKTTNPEKNIFSIHNRLKIAAIFIAIVCAVWFITDGRNPNEGIDKKYTSSLVQLEDGSVINLDTLTTLSEKTFRSVSLKGRAYFDIAENKSSAFTVETNHGTLTVVGTEFNIITDDRYTQIYVTEGTVKHFYEGKQYLLTVGDQLTITKHDIKQLSKPNLQVTAWKSKNLTFENASLHEVLESVASYYRIEIVFPNQDYNDLCKINTSYTKEDIQQILKELSIIVGLKYDISNNTIFVKSYKC